MSMQSAPQRVAARLGREARSAAPHDPADKLTALRRATALSFPTADIDRMLAEIERGYTTAVGR